VADGLRGAWSEANDIDIDVPKSMSHYRAFEKLDEVLHGESIRNLAFSPSLPLSVCIYLSLSIKCVCLYQVCVCVCMCGFTTLILFLHLYILFFLCPGPFPYGYDTQQKVNRNADTFLDTEHGHGANDGSIRSEVASFIDICCGFFRSSPTSLIFTAK